MSKKRKALEGGGARLPPEDPRACFGAGEEQGVHRAERNGMAVFSNMESVDLFVEDAKDHNVTSHPDHEIHLPPRMFLLFAGKCPQHSG
ncbi:hypothetical protein AV530_005321 [Patagioenas fasciata monilis]|uniref:Uncharacterized protein n=1 Tax=Patagioenas fasciata monilis TaxID=372326 RepID=A0A1V4JL46_PATFA|nr:hypothetical protein AV530_005321 [Patagioenas fasciata monilis]